MKSMGPSWENLTIKPGLKGLRNEIFTLDQLINTSPMEIQGDHLITALTSCNKHGSRIQSKTILIAKHI